MRRTATTANAILGLLALRPTWSTWELATQLRRNMRFFWPRAESRVYEEVKRLHERGFASLADAVGFAHLDQFARAARLAPASAEAGVR